MSTFKGTPGYEVDKYGQVFSMGHNWRGYGARLLVQDKNKDGYMCVRLTINGVRKRYRVHTLVAIKFLGKKPKSADQIRHLDGNKLNNHVSNLAWGNAKSNADDRDKHGRTSKGLKHSLATKQALYITKATTI